ncbi:hypothetical protein KCU59_g166, partial [Aureobasidium melanogenum]
MGSPLVLLPRSIKHGAEGGQREWRKQYKIPEGYGGACGNIWMCDGRRVAALVPFEHEMDPRRVLLFRPSSRNTECGFSKAASCLLLSRSFHTRLHHDS